MSCTDFYCPSCDQKIMVIDATFDSCECESCGGIMLLKGGESNED